MQIQEQTELVAQVQADLGQKKHCVQHFKDQLQVCKRHCICQAPALHSCTFYTLTPDAYAYWWMTSATSCQFSDSAE